MSELGDNHIDYTWGESVTWTFPDRIAIPLNRDGRYAADLVLSGEEAGVLLDMLTDAANPENCAPYDRRRTIWTDRDAYDAAVERGDAVVARSSDRQPGGASENTGDHVAT